MKCQQCEKPATFHITELTGPQPQEVHLCEGCAKTYLMQDGGGPSVAPTLGNLLAKQLQLGKAAEKLAELDQRTCPVCGISFYEFRNQGRLGCPHDYVFFHKELVPLIANIHGETRHVGKRPRGCEGTGTDEQTELIRLRREMEAAKKKEHYERAAELRDQIRDLEGQIKSKGKQDAGRSASAAKQGSGSDPSGSDPSGSDKSGPAASGPGAAPEA